MKELALDKLDERLQKQVHQARDALKKGGQDYVLQVCGELLRKYPSAFEVRALMWKSILTLVSGSPTRFEWLRERLFGVQFIVSTRSLLKKDPLELVNRCDEVLRKKQVVPEIFEALEKASASLGWIETKVLACQAVVDLRPEKSAPRLALANALLEIQRPDQAIEHVEWVLAKEPANGEAQLLLKNASVAETLQRGNWEDTDTTFHSKVKET